MALNIAASFPGKSAVPSAAYPFGSAQDVTTPGAGNGTPLVADIYNDLFGMQQSFLAAAGLTANGSPDSVTNSQYLDAILLLTLGALSAPTGADNIGVSGSGSVQESLDALTTGQTGGLVVFTTKALLDAFTPSGSPEEESSYKVTNDPSSANNGFYHWDGVSAFDKDADLVQNVIDEANTSEGVSGKAVFDEDTKEIARTTRYRAGKNLFSFDDRNILSGFFINDAGNFQVNASFFVTGYIQIKENETLINNWNNANTSCQLFDGDLNVIFTSPLGQNNLVWQTGAEFARFSLLTTSEEQIEVGDTITDFEVFTQTTPETLVSGLDDDLQGQIDNIALFENLFDHTIAEDGFLKSIDGTHGTTVGFDVISGYIPLVEGQDIAFTDNIRLTNPYAIVQYDIDKNIIDFSEYPGAVFVTGLANVAFIRFTIELPTKAAAMIVYGTTVPQEYIGRVLEINPELLFKIQDQIDTNDIEILALQGRDVPDVNLFDKSVTLDGKYIKYNGTGEFTNNATFEVSDFIRLDPGQKLTGQGTTDWANPFGVYTYDENKNYLSTHEETSITITGQTGSFFIRVTNLIASRDLVQYEYGEVATSYQTYNLVLGNNFLPISLGNTHRLVLPNTVYMKSNSSPSIYFDNIAYTSMKQPKTIKINLGDNFERQWSYTGRAMGATSNIIFDYKSLNLDISYNAIAFDLEDIDQTQNNAKTLNLLCIGDSFTDIGTWVEETKILLEADGVTVNLQGTKGPPTESNESLSGGTMSTFLLNEFDSARNLTVTSVTTKPDTGYPGAKYTDSNGTQWTATGGVLSGGNGLLQFSFDGGGEPTQEMPVSGILTKVSGTGDAAISYSSFVAANRNPLWNLGAPLDFAYYKSYWGFATPDILVLAFAFNDIGQTISNVEPTVAEAKQIIDAFRAEYPTSKVIFSIGPMGARFNSTRNIDDYLKAFLQFVEAMKVQFEDDPAYNAWVIIAPSYAFVDLINGYGPTQLVPNPRYPSVEETYGGDGVHCNDTGMRQIADCVVPCIHKLLI